MKNSTLLYIYQKSIVCIKATAKENEVSMGKNGE